MSQVPARKPDAGEENVGSQAGPPETASRIRVLHLNSMLHGGGTDDQCAAMVSGLTQLGQAASVAGPPGRRFIAQLAARGAPFLPLPSEGPLKLGFILGAARLIRRERAQIVHAHHGRDFWPAVFAARLSGRRPRVVLTRHLAKSAGSGFTRALLLNRCAAVIAVSAFVARVLREGVYEPDAGELERRARPPLRGDHSRIHVIYGGIDTARFRPADASAQRREWGLAPGDYAFAVVGSYDLPRGKGQREFLQAAARVAETAPQARFFLAGRGQLRARLEADLRELGLTGKARLLPYTEDMPGLMNAIDCLAHPQVGTEAFGLVVLEAFACGRPVIASALDGLPEAFAAGGAGALVTPGDVGQLAQAMIAQARAPRPSTEERHRLHERVAAEYSVLANARRVLRLYRQLLEGS